MLDLGPPLRMPSASVLQLTTIRHKEDDGPWSEGAAETYFRPYILKARRGDDREAQQKDIGLRITQWPQPTTLARPAQHESARSRLAKAHS
jgi:hypothetical protein